MSIWQKAGEWYDTTTENITEWWAGEDQQAASENSGIPGNDGGIVQPKQPINWTAAGVVVGVGSILVTLLKK